MNDMEYENLLKVFYSYSKFVAVQDHNDLGPVPRIWQTMVFTAHHCLPNPLIVPYKYNNYVRKNLMSVALRSVNNKVRLLFPLMLVCVPTYA